MKNTFFLENGELITLFSLLKIDVKPNVTGQKNVLSI
jgi:hypothetical protein